MKNLKIFEDYIKESNGKIDLAAIEDDLMDYKNKRKTEKLLVVAGIDVAKLNLKGNENEIGKPVFGSWIWKKNTNTGSEPAIISINLFIKDEEYFMTIGDAGYPQIVKFVKDKEPSFDEKIINSLDKLLKSNEELFGKDKFAIIMNDIFRIYAKHGADVNFNYKDFREIIKK